MLCIFIVQFYTALINQSLTNWWYIFRFKYVLSMVRLNCRRKGFNIA